MLRASMVACWMLLYAPTLPKQFHVPVQESSTAEAFTVYQSHRDFIKQRRQFVVWSIREVY